MGARHDAGPSPALTRTISYENIRSHVTVNGGGPMQQQESWFMAIGAGAALLCFLAALYGLCLIANVLINAH